MGRRSSCETISATPSPRVSVTGCTIAATRIFTNTAHYSVRESIYTKTFYTVTPLLGWIAAFISVLGIGFAISARYHLGRNWSGVPSVKEGHELVTSGPYKLVRHPIYTGILLAALGSALAGSLIGLFVLVFGTIVFLRRIKREEKIMVELFPNEYPAYKVRTKKLIPYLW